VSKYKLYRLYIYIAKFSVSLLTFLVIYLDVYFNKNFYFNILSKIYFHFSENKLVFENFHTLSVAVVKVR
jgi:hypothetical protein